MTNTSVFLWINGLAGHVRFFDEFFKGIANDYFALIISCLVLVWLWFSGRDAAQREKNQKTVFIAMISIGIASAIMAIINAHYFSRRPFDVLPSGSVHLLFYRPTDSSFPSNFAAVIFCIATAVFMRNRKYGYWLLALAVLGSFGRVYVGIHYPLDVLGGAGVGIAGAIISLGIGWVIRPLMNLLLKIFRFLYIA